jgi:hypothetical protein
MLGRGQALALLLIVWNCSCPGADMAEEFRPLLREERQLRRESIRLKYAAHKALDALQYDTVIDLHRRGAELERKADGLVDDMVGRLKPTLEGDDFDAREEATRRLSMLSRGAIPHLRAIADKSEFDARQRLRAAIEKLIDADHDDEGYYRQWAVEAKASSELSSPYYGAQQATGEPNTFIATYNPKAWAPKKRDRTEEWIELDYKKAVTPVLVRVYETADPGTIVRVECKDADGKWHTLWEGKDPTGKGPAAFEIKAAEGAPLTKVLRVSLVRARGDDQNLIDAVELIGEEP